MKHIAKFIVLAAVMLTACESRLLDGTINQHKVSVVKEGRHDFDFSLKVTTHKGIRVHAYFPASSYCQVASVDSYDYSKGLGLMYGFDNHRHVAMLGWRMIGGQVQCSYFVHPEDKSMVFLPLGKTVNFPLDTWFFYEIHDRQDHWYYLFSDGSEFSIPKSEKVKPPYRINGWWYGGTSPAPCDTEVWWWLERLDD